MDMLLQSAMAFMDDQHILVRRSMVRPAERITPCQDSLQGVISFLALFSTWQVAKQEAEAKLQDAVNALHQAEAQNFMNSSVIEVRHSCEHAAL